MWEPHDPTALPTSKEKELNDEALRILSIELSAAKHLFYEAEVLLQQRQEEVARIEHKIERHRYYAVPVRKLPPEILAKIGIILAMSKDRYYWKAIWIFSWTCQAWRNALMANPNVWGARIVVPECRNQPSLLLAARYYAHGAHISLLVSIGDRTHPILTTILQYRPKQITALHLLIGGYSWSVGAFSNITALPNLRRISLYGDITRDRREDYQPLLNGLIPRKNCRLNYTRSSLVAYTQGPLGFSANYPLFIWSYVPYLQQSAL